MQKIFSVKNTKNEKYNSIGLKIFNKGLSRYNSPNLFLKIYSRKITYEKIKKITLRNYSEEDILKNENSFEEKPLKLNFEIIKKNDSKNTEEKYIILKNLNLNARSYNEFYIFYEGENINEAKDKLSIEFIFDNIIKNTTIGFINDRSPNYSKKREFLIMLGVSIGIILIIILIIIGLYKLWIRTIKNEEKKHLLRYLAEERENTEMGRKIIDSNYKQNHNIEMNKKNALILEDDCEDKI